MASKEIKMYRYALLGRNPEAAKLPWDGTFQQWFAYGISPSGRPTCGWFETPREIHPAEVAENEWEFVMSRTVKL